LLVFRKHSLSLVSECGLNEASTLRVFPGVILISKMFEGCVVVCVCVYDWWQKGWK